jgi:ubiquinone/menaquinone biosynthesis C-methylase UbiE
VDYIKSNKAAWEEAFERRKPNWGDYDYQKLLNEELPFLEADVIAELHNIEFKGKTIAQFCCNNGRELLSLMQLQPSAGVGFDIAENILAQARANAAKAGILNCDFVQTNILEVEERYYNQFDFIFFTIGAITWFEDLVSPFNIVAKCLKPRGILLVNDFHPLMNMLATPDEEAFDPNCINKIAYPYFRDEPWLENDGMGYMSGQYASKTFTCFTHTISEIINSTINAGMTIKKWNEYNYDVGLTDIYDKLEYPLSYIMIAEKN